MMPNAKLSVVGEGVAQVTSIVGWTGERYRLVLSLSAQNSVYTVAETACRRVEIYTTEVVMKGIEIQTVLRNSACSTEKERMSIG